MTIFDDFDFPVVKTYSDLTEDYFEEWDKESKTAEEEATAASVDVQNVAALDAEIALEPDVSPPQESPPDTEEPLQTESDMTQANERENGGEVPDPGVFVVPDHGAAIDASDGGMKNGEG